MRPYLPYRPYQPYWAGIASERIAPLLSTVEVGTVGYDSLIVVFSEPVESTDFTLGWTITVNGVSRTLVTASLTTPTTLRIVITGRIYDDQVVLISYNAAVGTITDVSGIPVKNDLASFTNTAVTNNVTSLFNFKWFPADEILISGPYVVEQLEFTAAQRTQAITLSATQFGAL